MTATLANAHALFCGLKTAPSYLAQLDIGDDARHNLMAARQKARSALRTAANAIALVDSYWQDEWQSAVRRALRTRVEVKFMTQGSFAYKTINDPARPHQEIDLDDGMYVPVEFLDNGQPALTARGLFDFVVNTLTPLARAEGWQSVVRKQNCVRVNLWDGAHLDIPIYSIPRDRFAQITEAMAKSFSDAKLTRTAMMDSYRLPPDKIMLARKDGTWIQSDPQKLQDWVDGRVGQYGAVYRRLCRFFKGWRDHSWQNGELSSLCLMCAIDLALIEFSNEEGGLPTEERDDFLVMEVAKRLPRILQNEICNPVLDSCLNGWDDPTRTDIVTKANALSAQMVAALERTGDAEEVVKKLRTTFGQRIPYRPDAVKIAGTQIAAIVHAQPAKNPAPLVIASTSG
jgi:hypothetical protein